ncbi:MAG: TonB-dependent receptor [Bacteroidota bacterium]
MKSLVSLIALACCCQVAIAQHPGGGTTPTSGADQGIAAPKGHGKISGTVVDSTNQQAVPFATVALIDMASNKPIDGTICDEKGKFTLSKIPAGSYKLSFTFIGYKTVEKTSIAVADKGTDINLGQVLIASETKRLKEVTVTAQKSLIEEKVDRTVYNAEIDQTTKGGDATDVLKRVPMLSVDMDGNVSMRGSQNIKVLINNKPSTIVSSSIADALKQIPADQIKSVEVITSPSAKYDAEGSGGIINIITKKNNLQGASLGIDGSIGLRGSNLGLNGSYRKGKMGFSLGGFGRGNYNVRGSYENSQLNTSDSTQVLNQQTANIRNNNLFGRYTLGWDYDLNKFNSLTASIQYGLRNGNNYQDNLLTQTYRNNALDNSSLRNVAVADLSGTVDASLNYTHTFEKPQREFSILTLFSRNNRTNDFTNNILDESTLATLNRLKNQNASYNQEVTIQADYQTPIGKTQMFEIGGKDIMRKVSSDYKYFEADGADGVFVPSERQPTNVFNYHQNITSGYLSYTLSFLKTYSLKAGTRYEYTTIDAHFQNTNTELPIPSYGVLVPSVNLSKKLKNGSTLKAAYNRRIQRPSIQFLNPNVQNPNQLLITEGNPNLKPEYTNNYELSYNAFLKTSSLNFSTFMRNTTGSIQPLRTPGDNGVIKTTYQNIGNEDAYGFSIFANINLSNKFSLNGGTDVYYAVLDNNSTTKNQGWVPSGRIFGNYNFSKGWGLQLFTFYRGQQVQLQGKQAGFGIYSLSVKKDFHEKRGSIGFGAENFFTPTFKIRNEINSPGFQSISSNSMRTMSFKINFSYRIGKLSVDNGSRKRRKSVNNDDLKEGGDNGANGGGMQQQGTSGGSPSNAPAATTPGQGAKPGQYPGQKPARQDSIRTAPGQGQYPRTDSTNQGNRPPVQGQFPRQGQRPDSLPTVPPADTTQPKDQAKPQEKPLSTEPK